MESIDTVAAWHDIVRRQDPGDLHASWLTKVMVRPLKAVNALHQRMAAVLSERIEPAV